MTLDSGTPRTSWKYFCMDGTDSGTFGGVLILLGLDSYLDVKAEGGLGLSAFVGDYQGVLAGIRCRALHHVKADLWRDNKMN